MGTEAFAVIQVRGDAGFALRGGRTYKTCSEIRGGCEGRGGSDDSQFG